MNQYVVYILKWTRYYVWSTNNLERRLEEHKRWKTSTTKRIGEWKLLWYVLCKGVEEAKMIEKSIKKWWHYERWVEANKESIVSG